MGKHKRYTAFAIVALIFVLSACGSGKSSDNGPYDIENMRQEMGLSAPSFFGGRSNAPAPAAAAPMAQMPAPSTAPELYAGSYDTNGSATSEAKVSKKVKTGQMEMLADDTDSAVSQLECAVLYYGGYVESRNVNAYSDDKWASLTLRVPSAYYEMLVEDAYEIGEVYDFYDSVIDMGGEYYDVKSWLDVSLAEESRLLALIEKTEKIEDIITLEMRLGDVRVEIAMYENRLKEIDRKVGYSTLNINISQKSNPRIRNISKSLPDRMIDAFKNSANGIVNMVENIIIMLTYFSVPLSVLAVCVFIGRAVYKKTGKRNSI